MSNDQSAKTVATWLLERCNELRKERDMAQARASMLERDTDCLIRRLEELENGGAVVQVQYLPDPTPPAIAAVRRDEFEL
jgi:hypothetical protein